MTEREVIKRKILLQQQAIPQLAGERNWQAVERCRNRIRTLRKKLWELEGGAEHKAVAV